MQSVMLGLPLSLPRKGCITCTHQYPVLDIYYVFFTNNGAWHNLQVARLGLKSAMIYVRCRDPVGICEQYLAVCGLLPVGCFVS